MLTLGIDIGGTFIKFAHVNESLEIIKQWEVETKLTKTVEEFYDYLILSAGDLSNVTKIGVSAPGVIASDSTVTSIASPHVEIMYGHSINEMISSRTNLPCYTMNDAKAAGYCEVKLGAAKGSSSSMVFIIGTGIGGALVKGEEVLEGVDGYAGEFSRIPMRDVRGKFGIAAQFASASTLVLKYNEIHPNSVTKAKDVFDLFYEGDSEAISIMNEWLDNIALLLGILVSIYNPEVICIGGGVTKDKNLIKNIQASFDKFYRTVLFAQPKLSTEIRHCEYESHANIMGAVLNANEKNANSI